jgi:SpoVK/Ycf46/Vps4 family AAA+-type ATPase
MLRERGGGAGVVRILGIPYRLFDRVDDDQIVTCRIRAHLEKWLVTFEDWPPAIERGLRRNIEWLSGALGLEPVEEELLALLLLLQAEEGLREAVATLAAGRVERLYEVLACALGLPAGPIRRALSPRRPLVGMLQVRLFPDRRHEVVAFAEGLGSALLTPFSRQRELFDLFCRSVEKSALSLADFPHLVNDTEPLRRHLAGALAQGVRGAHLLLHGAPGTGKTELARALAASVGARLFEVPVEAGSGEALSGKARLVSFTIAQRLLAGMGQSVLLFDELEDAFPVSGLRLFGAPVSGPTHGGEKGWTNRLLEEAQVPTIWIGNSVEQIDPAFLRRFDLVIEVPPPSREVRRRIVERHGAALPLRQPFVDGVASDERLRPADVVRASRVATLASPENAEDAERIFGHALEAGFVAEGRLASPPAARADLGAWDPGVTNASPPLEEVVAAFQGRATGTMLLYGKPGTGKSAFVAALGESIRRPVVVRRASDVLSMWVGGTERLLAAAFRQARAAGAILFLDEADGFLEDRRSASHRWELTQTNELLQQIEGFDGILACATNLVERIDGAAFRRFALKIRFEPLRPEQGRRLVLRTLGSLGCDLPAEADLEKASAALARVGPLTPGDFAAVARRLRLLSTRTSGSVSPIDAFRIIEELKQETALGIRARRAPIGFGS